MNNPMLGDGFIHQCFDILNLVHGLAILLESRHYKTCQLQRPTLTAMKIIPRHFSLPLFLFGELSRHHLFEAFLPMNKPVLGDGFMLQ